jgi:hypothetical protein
MMNGKPRRRTPAFIGLLVMLLLPSCSSDSARPRPSPSDDRFDAVDAALAELVSGNVAFNTPERMRFREIRTITLLVSPQLEPERLAQELRKRIGRDDRIDIEAAQIAPVMEAQIVGAPAFEVTPLSPPSQAVSGAVPTEWRWDVRANEAGTRTLHLTITAILMVAGERFPRSLNVVDRDIEVEISAAQQAGRFVQTNWQWLAGTIIIPFVVWFWNRSEREATERT